MRKNSSQRLWNRQFLEIRFAELLLKKAHKLKQFPQLLVPDVDTNGLRCNLVHLKGAKQSCLFGRIIDIHLHSRQFQSGSKVGSSNVGLTGLVGYALDQLYMAFQLGFHPVEVSQVNGCIEAIIELFCFAVEHVDRREDHAAKWSIPYGSRI